MNEQSTYANPAVLEFYRALPFNIRDTVESSAAAIRQTDHASAYPVLRPLLRPGVRALDVGCGTGWFANSLAYHHRAEVTGLDFNPVAVERAREVAAALALSTVFAVGDLFSFEPERPFDLVVSLGVLHHTDNCLEALRRVCGRFVRPGGHVLIGLYHSHGRKPLLDHFQAMKSRGATEPEMLQRYRELHSQIKDETLLLSWFRDQVLHPHETQHTLAEVVPVLRQAGFDLVSTSINRFQPIADLDALYEEEKNLRGVALDRLRENKYFTGFFVFLAQKQGAPEAGSRLLDTKRYVEHHPVYGYQYIAGTDLELPRPGGGRYRIRVNSEGIRSDREYSHKKPPGVRRIIVCGDSMSAGQYIDNAHRFGEMLERRFPGLEVMNLSLEGSGTDQQLLVYEHVGLRYEHDLVLVFPFLQNIRRNLVDAREGIDPATGEIVLRGKPRFELVENELVLRNVPVPIRLAVPAQGKDLATDARSGWQQRLKTRLSGLPGADLVKKALYALIPWEPFPEYRYPEGNAWRLMEAILRRFKVLAGDRLVVIAPTFYVNYVTMRMARNYWRRYASLAAIPGVHVIDLLPHFLAVGDGVSRCFQDPFDMHFSAYGHLTLAEAVGQELIKLDFLPNTDT